ncbi:hypothetical protein NDU88_001335 [Pleurodeles waltl]|uniref:Uncharacterized protein n=1 Tax=Pleurodeles waltl TaxID=8319 RepID=A0AAV7VBI5_PLEWA|nr:hypothetical protein NDU88_001335 [Pleurodeles waltl]
MPGGFSGPGWLPRVKVGVLEALEASGHALGTRVAGEEAAAADSCPRGGGRLSEVLSYVRDLKMFPHLRGNRVCPRDPWHTFGVTQDGMATLDAGPRSF